MSANNGTNGFAATGAANVGSANGSAASSLASAESPLQIKDKAEEHVATESDYVFQSFEEFWPFYIGEHRLPITRMFHYVGTSTGIAIAATAALTRKPLLAPLALVAGYGPAWVSHFFLEDNKPASFKYPLWSFQADFKMLSLALRGKMDDEVTRLYGSPNPSKDAPLIIENLTPEELHPGLQSSAQAVAE